MKLSTIPTKKKAWRSSWLSDFGGHFVSDFGFSGYFPRLYFYPSIQILIYIFKKQNDSKNHTRISAAQKLHRSIDCSHRDDSEKVWFHGGIPENDRPPTT